MRFRRDTWTAVVLAVTAAASVARAQAPGPDAAPAPAPAPASPPSGSSGATATPGAAPGTVVYQPLGLPAPGTDVNAGLPSSSRPITGDQRDGFDLGSGRGGGGPSVVYGEKGASGVVRVDGRAGVGGAYIPDVHLVRRGDTLWDLSAHYYRNPYNWPKIWGQNPQVKDPHWIYPGDQLRMRDPNDTSRGLGDGAEQSLLGGRRRDGSDGIFLRDRGFIGDPERDVWGELIGAVEEQMLLADGNRVYLKMHPGHDPVPGDELTLFRRVRKPDAVAGARQPPGEIVAVNGTVRIDTFDPRTRIARAEIVESLDAIERGAKAGPVRRRFHLVPARTNHREVVARVLNSFYPHVYVAQNQLVFIDRGRLDGLEPGNTLLVLRRGDTWRRSLTGASKMARDRLRLDSAENVDVEPTPLVGKQADFPDEVVAALRVLRTEDKSSVALVVSSRREVVPGDRAVAPAGE